jgi:hypothetical protein
LRVSEWTCLKGVARGRVFGKLALYPSDSRETDRPPETTQPSPITMPVSADAASRHATR